MRLLVVSSSGRSGVMVRCRLDLGVILVQLRVVLALLLVSDDGPLVSLLGCRRVALMIVGLACVNGVVVMLPELMLVVMVVQRLLLLMMLLLLLLLVVVMVVLLLLVLVLVLVLRLRLRLLLMVNKIVGGDCSVLHN